MADKPPSPIDGIEAAARETARAAKRELIARALAEAKGNRTRAALALGYGSASNLRRAAQRAGVDLDAPEFAAPPPTEFGGLRLTDEERAARPPAPKKKPRAKKAAKRAARGKR